MTESLHLPEDSDRYAAEMFDAQRAEILAFFLVAICEDPADRVSTRSSGFLCWGWRLCVGGVGREGVGGVGGVDTRGVGVCDGW